MFTVQSSFQIKATLAWFYHLGKLAVVVINVIDPKFLQIVFTFNVCLIFIHLIVYKDKPLSLNRSLKLKLIFVINIVEIFLIIKAFNKFCSFI